MQPSLDHFKTTGPILKSHSLRDLYFYYARKYWGWLRYRAPDDWEQTVWLAICQHLPGIYAATVLKREMLVLASSLGLHLTHESQVIQLGSPQHLERRGICLAACRAGGRVSAEARKLKGEEQCKAKWAAASEMRDAGKSLREIAVTLGYSRESGASYAIAKGRKQL